MEGSGVGEQLRTSIEQLTAWLLLETALVFAIRYFETGASVLGASDRTRKQRPRLNRSLVIIMDDEA